MTTNNVGKVPSLTRGAVIHWLLPGAEIPQAVRDTAAYQAAVERYAIARHDGGMSVTGAQELAVEAAMGVAHGA